MSKCKDCNKEITSRSKKGRCPSCCKKGKLNPMYGKSSAMKGLFGKYHPHWKGGKPRCVDCKKLLTNLYAKRCPTCWYKIAKLSMKKRICKHHIDMNIKNNRKENFLYLKVKNHLNIHKFAYQYIIHKFGIKEIKRYITWFLKNHAE
jgi:hypothetical protein